MRRIYLLLILACPFTTTVNGQRPAAYTFSLLPAVANNYTYAGDKSVGGTMAEILSDTRTEVLVAGTDKSTAFEYCEVINLAASSITTNSVNLTWDVTSGSLGYEYAVTTSAISPASGTATTNNFVTSVTGLTSGTVYYAHVRSDCGAGFGIWSTTASFNTLCDPIISFPFTETFENSSATKICWKRNESVTGVLDWTYGAGPGGTGATTSTAHSGALNALLYEGDFATTNVTRLVSPKLDLSSLTGGAQVRFWYVNEEWLGSQDELRVYYKTSAAGSWTLIPGATFDTDQPTWIEATFTLPSIGSDYYIAFESTENYGHGVAIDDIVVEAVPTCFTPLVNSLSAVATSKSAAAISWAAASPSPANGYEWKVVLSGAGSGGSAVASGSTAAGVVTASATGLTAATTYDLFVRSNCGGSDFSSYAGPKSFFLQDDAAGAITLTVGAGCTGAIYSNAGASRSNLGTPEVYPSCSGIIVAPVWFKFVAPVSGAVRISTDLGTGTSFADSKMGLFAVTDSSNYSSSSFSIISCDDDGGSAQGVGYMSVIYATGLIPGNRYYIAVDRSDSTKNSGTFCIAVDELDNTMIAASTINCSTDIENPFGSAAGYSGWIPLVDDADSKLIALIRNPAGGIVGNYNVSLNVNPSATVRTDLTSSQRYLDRNFHLDSAGVSTVNSLQVQLFFRNSELSALQAVDPGVTLANLGVTRQTGATCQGDFVAANGTNTYILQTGSGTVNGAGWISLTTGGLSNFYLHTSKAPVTMKTFLQGAYDGAALRHRDVTTTWRDVLRASATTQPFNNIAYGNLGYNGTETVSATIFNSTAGTTDIVDWVLLELRNAPPPAAAIASRAAFILEDGSIVDLDGVSSVGFRGVANGNYYVTIRHRNHLGIRSATLQTLEGVLGSNPAPALYNFSSSLTQAFKDVTITTNEAMAQNGGVYLMWAGNANGDNFVRVTTQTLPVSITGDGVFILGTILAGVPNATLSGYSVGDINMDGKVRTITQTLPVTIPGDTNFILSTPLGGAPNATRREHK